MTQSSIDHQIQQALEIDREELVDLSLDIHAHPELNYQEFYAAKRLSDLLEARGFEVERGIANVPTAFRGTIKGNGEGPTVGILVEYDALPDIGHACGHNLIATATVGAGLALQTVLGDLPGTIQIIGTPAEEGGGGKIKLIEGGVFEGVDIALSCHPAADHTYVAEVVPQDERWSLAMVGFRYIYHGKSAHAAMAPQDGINALNSVLHLFTGIDALRQHLRQDVRMHGIVSNGGKAPNVVPDYASADFMLRAADRDYLRGVVEKVQKIAEGAALITGATLEIQPLYPFYEEVVPNQPLSKQFAQRSRDVGFVVEAPKSKGSGASTDLGNVSQIIPTAALSYAISPKPVAYHTPELAEIAKSDLAQDRTIMAAKAIALVAADLLRNPALVEEAKADFALRTNQ
jgi:amidohydrolase